MVNIGLHYVAAASGKPKDTDTSSPDGIPDYVEDANGNGVPDADETNFQVTDTDGDGQSDAYDTKYDDIDLDGDGLPGYMENWLLTNPLVSDNPITIVGVPAGGVLSGDVNIQIQVASGFDVQYLSLSSAADGHHLPHTPTIQPPFSSPITIQVPTTRLENGIYVVTARGLLKPNSIPDPGLLISETIGKPVVVQVFNEISFGEAHYSDGSLAQDEWRDTYGDGAMAVNAVSAHAPIEYEIKMLNDASQTVYTFPLSQSPDGLINTEWNLQNEVGVLQESPYFAAQITTYWPSRSDFLANAVGSGSASINSPPTFSLTATFWPAQGGWVISRQDFTKTFTASLPTSDGIHNGKAMLEGVFDGFYEDLYYDAAFDLTGVTPYPLPDTGYSDTAHVLGFLPNTTQPQRDASWSTFVDAIDDSPSYISRNLWYLGHGHGNSIGADLNAQSPTGGPIPKTLPGSHAFRFSGQIDALLQNHRFNQPTFHPYRFVFLDGCETATGEWASVFGIPETPKTQSHYFSPVTGTLIVRPNAFVGWKEQIFFSPKGGIAAVYPGFAKFREQLYVLWGGSSKPAFRSCVNDANRIAKEYNPQAVQPVTGQQPMDWQKEILIFGYDQITFQMGNYSDPTRY